MTLAMDSFPHVHSVQSEIRRALDWLAIQPKTRRKKDIPKFLRNWVDKADAAGKYAAKPKRGYNPLDDGDPVYEDDPRLDRLFAEMEQDKAGGA